MSGSGNCYECYSTCVSDPGFCGNAGHGSTNINLPKTMIVKVEANAAYWGFGGVLFSGEVEYGSNSYDYWDNFDEDYLTNKACGDNIVRNLNNEERPDVSYRSVYDPDSGVVTYNGNTEIDSVGGPSTYLIDKTAIETVDSSSCDTTNPQSVFRMYPERYGYGNKILFENDVYKNLTGAWRGSESGVVQSSGLPDGAVAGPYTGSLTESGIYRNSGDPFIYLDLSYNNGAASGVRNGGLVIVKDSDASQLPDGIYYLTGVAHGASSTTAKVVGTVGAEIFTSPASLTT